MKRNKRSERQTERMATCVSNRTTLNDIIKEFPVRPALLSVIKDGRLDAYGGLLTLLSR